MFASLNGGEAPIDLLSLQAPFTTANTDKFSKDPLAMKALRETNVLSKLNTDDWRGPKAGHSRPGRTRRRSRLSRQPQQVIAAVEKLPDAQRAVMLLVAGEGLSHLEAAEVLEVPIGTVMSRLSRARLMIGESFGALSDQTSRTGSDNSPQASVGHGCSSASQ